jgi:hypothetical protein
MTCRHGSRVSAQRSAVCRVVDQRHFTFAPAHLADNVVLYAVRCEIEDGCCAEANAGYPVSTRITCRCRQSTFGIGTLWRGLLLSRRSLLRRELVIFAQIAGMLVVL